MIIKNDKIVARIDETSTTNGLVGWWSFNNNLNDVSGNGNNGTHSGTPAYVAGIPDGGKGLHFNGTSDYVDCGSGASLNSTAYTMCAWIKTSITAPNTNRGFHIISILAYSTTVKTALIQRGTKVGVYTGATALSSTSINDNKWHHITGVHSNGVSKIYVDGLWEDDGTDALAGAFLKVKVGTFLDTPSGANYGTFNGLIDDVRIYNRALTDKEIKQLCKGFKQ